MSSSVSTKNAGYLFPADERAVMDACEYADNKVLEMKKLICEFDDKGALGLFWDSKIPDNCTGFWNRFPWVSLKSSDRDEVIAEIKKYKQFYAELRRSVTSAGNGDMDDDENPYDIVLDLYDKLSTMENVARSGKQRTTSKAVHKLHKDFISNRFEVENKIRRVECSILKKEIGKIGKTCEDSLNVIGQMSEEVRNLRAENQSFKRVMEQQMDKDRKRQEKLAEVMLQDKKEMVQLFRGLLEQLSLLRVEQ